ncbi:MAG: copper amine oxidase N-terminal protein, partial [Sedimentibacter sp.]|nr:copper amine oxidase N-terminal protein [Sedimentibacter sp.]
YIDEDGTVMVPLRAISEALKYEVTWNNEERCIMVGTDVKVKIDTSSVTAAGKVIELESAALIKDDRTYVPLSFFKEALGVNVVSFFENNIIINTGRYMAD